MTVLGIFAKQPIPGRVKTRLAAGLGPVKAAEIYGAFVEDLVNRFGDVADRRVLCHAPDNPAAINYFRRVAEENFELWPQPGSTSLGERMSAFFDFAISLGAQRVVLIGSDSPSLPVDFVEMAFKILEKSDCVLGPATDGGYYLVGQRQPGWRIFENIEWSSPGVLEQTVRQIEGQGASLQLLPVWYDIDTLDDLNMLRGHLRALRYSGSDPGLTKTEQQL